MDGEKYVSMFKINGIPILPPLMTAARRREMQAYKELAVALETRLKLEAKRKETPGTQVDDQDSICTLEDEYLKVSSMLQDHFSPAKLPRQTDKKQGSTESLKKSDTFIYDINTNTVMIPKDDVVLTDPSSNICNTKFSNISRVDSTMDTKVVGATPPAKKNLAKLSKYITPSINIKPPTPESKNVELDTKCQDTPPKKNTVAKETTPRASTAPSVKSSSADLLVRSNSFTLESPSPVLLQHMVRSRCKYSEHQEDLSAKSVRTPPKDAIRRSRTVTSDPYETVLLSPKRTVPCSRPKVHATSNPNTISDPTKLNTLAASNSKLFKTKKSPYDIKLVGKPKMMKKHKMPLKKISSVTLKPRLSVSHHHRSRLQIASPSSEKSAPARASKLPTPVTSPGRRGNIELVQARVREIEEQHRMRLMELMKQQQEEQRLMQEQFERQQKQLLSEFSAGLMSLKALSNSDIDERPVEVPRMHKDFPNEDNVSNHSRGIDGIVLDESQCYDMTATLAPSIMKSKNTPRCSRRLFASYNSALTPRQRGIYGESPMASAESMKESTRVQSARNRRKEDAATIINAYARGYLVRRLFRTMHVHNIVRTIRDTLIFVLNFHLETGPKTSEDNILFKARLLQQLTSACQSLKTVFSLPAKEKMLIIARDRIKNQSKAKGQNKFNRKG